jgi:IS30 family transposase
MTSIGTLVERTSRDVMLLRLPNGHGAAAVRKAMTKRITTLPAQLRRSITWDRSVSGNLIAGRRSEHLERLTRLREFGWRR